MLDDLDPGFLAGFGEEGGEVAVVEPGEVELREARALGVIRAAQLLEVDIGEGAGDGEERMLRVVPRAQVTELLAEQRDEHDGALGPGGEGRESVGNLDHRGGAAGVVVGAVIDVIAITGAANTQVIVVRGE